MGDPRAGGRAGHFGRRRHPRLRHLSPLTTWACVARPAPSPPGGAVEGPTPPASIRVSVRDSFRTAHQGGWAQAVGDFAHEPVMVAEVVDAFAPVAVGLLVDGTVGGGGHSAAILRARPDSVVLGLDRDAEAVAAAGERLSGYGARALVRQSGFEDLAGVLASPE